MKIYNKRILLSVTGMSPAVVTETLYALVMEKNFIPTEIQVITTIQGKNKLLSALLGIEGGRKERKGALQEFIEDYGSQYGFDHIHFDESSIHIIEDASGQKLPDIRTPQENEFAADNIVKLVGSLCQDDDAQLHVSIAGGRKTMGFFMGYALSLYGREQDSLSHVLVDEAFETLPNFYYRKPQTHLIVNERNGKELDASTANIMLAEIPWVRLGLGISDDLKDKKISYSESIKNAQILLQEPKLIFKVDEKTEDSAEENDTVRQCRIQIGDKLIKLSPKPYTLLLSMIIAQKQNWVFGIAEEEKSMRVYSTIYKEILFRNMERDNDLMGIISESREQLRKKLISHFSVGKNVKMPYLPKPIKIQNERKQTLKGNYQLDIDLENVDLSEIASILSAYHLIKK